MTFDLLNPLMLIGLAGLSLPILVHLLSRKNYDVVDYPGSPRWSPRKGIRSPWWKYPRKS